MMLQFSIFYFRNLSQYFDEFDNVDMIPFTPDLKRQHKTNIATNKSTICYEEQTDSSDNRHTNSSLPSPIRQAITETETTETAILDLQDNNTSNNSSNNTEAVVATADSLTSSQNNNNNQTLFNSTLLLGSSSSSAMSHGLRHFHTTPLKNLTASPYHDVSLPLLPPSPPLSLHINLFEEKVKKYWSFICKHEYHIDSLLQTWCLEPFLFGAKNTVNQKLQENGV